jgi:hypothetical protein
MTEALGFGLSRPAFEGFFGFSSKRPSIAGRLRG